MPCMSTICPFTECINICSKLVFRIALSHAVWSAVVPLIERCRDLLTNGDSLLCRDGDYRAQFKRRSHMPHRAGIQRMRTAVVFPLHDSFPPGFLRLRGPEPATPSGSRYSIPLHVRQNPRFSEHEGLTFAQFYRISGFHFFVSTRTTHCCNFTAREALETSMTGGERLRQDHAGTSSSAENIPKESEMVCTHKHRIISKPAFHCVTGCSVIHCFVR